MNYTLAATVKFSGMKRPAHDARRLRGFLDWMDDGAHLHHPPGSSARDYVAKRQRYDLWHAAALAVFDHLTSKMKMPLETADYIVANQWLAIFDAVKNHSQCVKHPDDHIFIGIINYNNENDRNHVSGKFSDCIERYRKAQYEAVELARSGKSGAAILATPISIALVDLTEIYRGVEERMLRETKAAVKPGASAVSVQKGGTDD